MRSYCDNSCTSLIPLYLALHDRTSNTNNIYLIIDIHPYNAPMLTYYGSSGMLDAAGLQIQYGEIGEDPPNPPQSEL